MSNRSDKLKLLTESGYFSHITDDLSNKDITRCMNIYTLVTELPIKLLRPVNANFIYRSFLENYMLKELSPKEILKELVRLSDSTLTDVFRVCNESLNSMQSILDTNDLLCVYVKHLISKKIKSNEIF